MSTRLALGAILLIGSIAGVSVISSNSPAQTQSDSAATKIHDLLQQKHQLLKQRVEAFEMLSHQKADGIEEKLADTISARIDLLENKLLLATDKPERLAVLRERLIQYKEYETTLNALGNRLQGSERTTTFTRSLLVSSKRIDAEIDLLREEASVK